jgi:hypothetical protein
MNEVPLYVQQPGSVPVCLGSRIWCAVALSRSKVDECAPKVEGCAPKVGGCAPCSLSNHMHTFLPAARVTPSQTNVIE